MGDSTTLKKYNGSRGQKRRETTFYKFICSNFVKTLQLSKTLVADE